jgi:diacylglycerol kinase
LNTAENPPSSVKYTTESHAHAPARPFGRILRSFSYAFDGLGLILRTQPNFWVHLVLAAAALVLAMLLRLPPAEIVVLILSIGLVLVVESLNTALETLCDVASPGYHPLIKRAKDISAAAVLLAALTAIGVGLVLFVPRLLAAF